MLQNKISFHQSSVSLEIVGLPDYAINESSDQISIISEWKLLIFDKPPIEGKIEHLSLVMEAFYIYSNRLINNQIPIYESKLIDLKTDNFYEHSLVLKSSKENVKPLNITIGNSLFTDIINCFDQLNSSNKVRKFNFNQSNQSQKKGIFKNVNKLKFTNFLLPPLISIFTLILLSLTFNYFNNSIENKENNSSLYQNLVE